MFFFFKQKTAYELRISDWSSDVCSSDLHAPAAAFSPGGVSACHPPGVARIQQRNRPGDQGNQPGLDHCRHGAYGVCQQHMNQRIAMVEKFIHASALYLLTTLYLLGMDTWVQRWTTMVRAGKKELQGTKK